MGWTRTAGVIAIPFQLGCGSSQTATAAPADTGSSPQDAADSAMGVADAGGRIDGSDGTIDVTADGGMTAADADDGSVGGDASALCGDASCSATQLCAYQSGGPVQCVPLNDAGGCSAPAMYMSSCTSLGNRPGCYVDFPPRPVRCVDIPPSCGTSPTCSCLSPDPCSSICGGGSQCLQIQSGALNCGCL